jgi:hypothetical protein
MKIMDAYVTEAQLLVNWLRTLRIIASMISYWLFSDSVNCRADLLRYTNWASSADHARLKLYDN